MPNNNEQLPRYLQLLYSLTKFANKVSMFLCPGSYVALKLLNGGDLSPWLNPKYVPFFGIPLLVVFCVSCLFGSQALISLIGVLYDKFQKLSDIERRYRDHDNNTPSQRDN